MHSIDIDLAPAVRRAAVRATRAPSIHNTQPWRFVQQDGALEIRADWTRQLLVLDPTGRQLLLSCGCALFNARAALAADGLDADVQRFPNPGRSDLVARVAPKHPGEGGRHTLLPSELDAAIDIRRSNRRQFDDEAVPDDLVDALMVAAHAEGAQVFPVRHPEHRAAVARLTQLADQIEYVQPAYRAELRRWTTDNPSRYDGVPAFAVPSVDGTAEDDVPIRDFDTRGTGGLPATTRSSSAQCLLLLGTNADNPGAWVQAGEALERVWLEIASRGYTASLFSQVIEVPRARAMLRGELGLGMHPHMLLRVGRAEPTPATRRRRLVDVLSATGSKT
jgi:nitroreductase